MSDIPPRAELTLGKEAELLIDTVFPPDEFPDPTQTPVDIERPDEVTA